MDTVWMVIFQMQKKIYEKAMAGEEAAFYAFNYTGELLGFALANAVAYTSPGSNISFWRTCWKRVNFLTQPFSALKKSAEHL